jgi:hypothetical protein
MHDLQSQSMQSQSTRWNTRRFLASSRKERPSPPETIQIGRCCAYTYDAYYKNNRVDVLNKFPEIRFVKITIDSFVNHKSLFWTLLYSDFEWLIPK